MLDRLLCTADYLPCLLLAGRLVHGDIVLRHPYPHKPMVRKSFFCTKLLCILPGQPHVPAAGQHKINICIAFKGGFQDKSFHHPWEPPRINRADHHKRRLGAQRLTVFVLKPFIDGHDFIPQFFSHPFCHIPAVAGPAEIQYHVFSSPVIIDAFQCLPKLPYQLFPPTEHMESVLFKLYRNNGMNANLTANGFSCYTGITKIQCGFF